MNRFLLIIFILFSCFSAHARHVESALSAEKAHIGDFFENTPDLHPGDQLYLLELHIAYNDFSFQDAHRPLNLWYFRARYFDNEMGRFISRDPLGYVDGFGLYNGYFAMGFALDPSGTDIITDCPIDKYLDSLGLANTYVRSVRDGKYWYIASESNEGDLTKQIVHNMMISMHEFHIAGKKDGTEGPNLGKHIEARKRIVERAKKFEMKYGPIKYKQPQSGDTALDHFNRENKSSNSCWCGRAAQFITDPERPLKGRSVDNIWIPGDSAYVINISAFNYPKRFPENNSQQGENIIYLGSKIWFGHISKGNQRKLDEWNKLVESWDKSIDGSSAAPGTAKAEQFLKPNDENIKKHIDATNTVLFPHVGLEK